uniref:Fanconi anemia group D2 protein n=1 Tax=Parascaris univalens TaxID=6257 RepID=A0A915BDR7_PARUN
VIYTFKIRPVMSVISGRKAAVCKMTNSGNDDLNIDFDDFDDVVAPDPDSSKPADPGDSFATDESVLNEKEFRRALDRFYVQTQNADICNAPIGERIEPESDFQKILEEIGMQRRVDDGGKISTYIADGITHNTFARNLDAYLEDTEKREIFLHSFEADIEDDDKTLLYLSPSVSERGPADTLFRALLLTKNAQAAVFEMVMKKAEYFAKDAQGDKGSNDRLALACIAQIRYLDVVYDPKPLFNSIFDRELEEWRCMARDVVIQSLPEILPNISTQQDAADNLRQMFLKTVNDNPYTFRISILRALTVLRTDAEMSDKIRGELIRNVMTIEPGVLPELVTYCLSTIQKDDKSSFRNVLCGLRGNLKIEKLKFRRGDNSKKTLGNIVTKIFVAISKKTKFGGTRLWKQVCTVLHVDEGWGHEDNERAESVDDILPKDAKEFELFDVLLSFALMDIENCDRLVFAAFKHQLLSIRHRIDEFKEIISTAIAFKEFSTRFLDAILSFSQHLIWSSEAHLISGGAFLLEKLFVSVEKHRERILNQITAHLNDIDSEATAALSILQNLVQKHADMLIPFIERLHGTFNLLSLLSTENIRRLFHVLVVLQMTSAENVDAQYQDEFKLRIDAMLSSPCARENTWGVIGLLMRLHAYIALGGHTEEELELTVSQTLATLDLKTRANSNVRAIFYSNLARLLDENPRMPRSEAMLEWSEILRQEFREVFFEKRNEEISSNRLEDDRYTRVECKEWLRLGEIVSEQLTEGSITKGLRIGELLPLFELLRAFARQKRRWEGDDTQEAYINHWTRFLFAFEANISMKGVDLEARENERRAINCDIFCYAIQWIRLLLNTFADCELPTAADNQLVGDVMRKKFALMLECQKSLIYTIKKVGEYPLPHMESSGRKEVIIHGEGGQILKKTPPTKRPVDVGTEENDVVTVHDADVILNDEEQNMEQEDEAGDAGKENAKVDADIGNTKAAIKLQPNEMAEHPTIRKRKSDCKRKLVDVNRVLSYFSPFRLVTVIRLIQLLPKKRKQTTFLLENLQKILEVVLPKKEKKVAPWMAYSEIPLGDMPVDHGDSKLVWRLISSVLPVLFSILDGSVQYFRSLMDTSTLDDRLKRDYFHQMAALLRASLCVLKDIFKCREVAKPQSSRDEACETEKSKRARFERRKYVMELIEKAMLDVDAVRDIGGEEDAEISVLNYLIKVADVIPSLDCAVELLDVFSAMEGVPDGQRLQIARAALSFLRKEWLDEGGNPLKGADLNRAVAMILYLYIRLRRESKRLLAIQWIITNKVAELVPDEERRRSKISHMEECIDSELGTEEEHAHFCCFTKGTFSSVYKVLFHSLNETVKTLSMNAIERSTLKLDEFFLQWKQAASCFCLLTLMIRIKDLRNSSVLLCAAREGRIFLHSFSSKSSFLHLLTAEKRFAKYAAGANSVMKTVQIGNRSLQNISVYAKTSKCIVLLKLLPELRAASEMFIRAVHS